MEDFFNTIHEMFNITIDPSKIEAPSDEAYLIVLSSLLFLVPAVYSYINGQLLITCILIITTILSVNFWRDARYTWRRIIDRTYAKMTFVYFAVNGFLYVTWLPFLIMGCIGSFGLIYCYYMSNKHCSSMNKNEVWCKYHIAFHFITICTQLMIIKSIVDHNSITTDHTNIAMNILQ
jgi:hypothetical protein